MGFDLVDIGNAGRILVVNFWNWRPTVEILSQAALLDEERLTVLKKHFSATSITKDEARSIACHLRKKILPTLAVPDQGEYQRSPEEFHKNYSSTRAWLEAFAEFCEECEGFEFSPHA